MSTTIDLLPNANIGPNDGNPVPAVDQYLNVDDEPHDGDTTHLYYSAINQTGVFGWDLSAISISDMIESLSVRWTVKRGGIGGTFQAKAGLRIGGLYYWGTTRTLAEDYTTYEELFPTDPSDSQIWSRAKLGTAYLAFQTVTIPAELPRMRLTAIHGRVTLLPGTTRLSAAASSLAPRAVGITDLIGLKAVPTSIAMKAVPSSLSPSAVAAVKENYKGGPS